MSLAEQTIFSAITYIGEGLLSALFFRAFLVRREKERFRVSLWTMLYLVPSLVLFVLLDNANPLHAVAWGLLRMVLLLLLQAVFFRFDFHKLSFLVISFLSGVYLLRSFITVLYIQIMDFVTDSFYRMSLTQEIESEEQLAYWMNALHVAELCCMGLTGLVYLALLAIYLRMLVKGFGQKDVPLTGRETVLLVLPCATAVTVYFFMRSMILANSDGPSLFSAHPVSRLYVPAISILLLSSIVAAVRLLQSELAHRETVKQQTLLEAQIAGIRNEVEEVNGLYDSIREMKHDLRAHVANIAALAGRIQSGGATTEDRESLHAYLTQMEDALDATALPYASGNPVTDVILSRWKADAGKRGLDFTASFRFPDGQTDAYDIAIILNNGLENAVTAAEDAKRENGSGSVCIRSRQKAALYFIEIINDYAGGILLDPQTELPCSSRADGASPEHGLGLKSIRRCAEKYLGAMDITLSEQDGRKIFVLTVMLNTGYLTE